MQKDKESLVGTKRKAGIQFATQVFQEFHQERRRAGNAKPQVSSQMQSMLNQIEQDAKSKFNKEDSSKYKAQIPQAQPIVDT